MRHNRYLITDPSRRVDIGDPLGRAVVEVRPNMIEKMLRHVTNPPPAGGSSGERDDRQEPASPAASRHRAWARLRRDICARHCAARPSRVSVRWRNEAEELGVNARTMHIANQHPATGILEAAATHNCDLIVMASHGRRGIQRLLLGSQTAEVLASSHAAVLVVR